MDAIHQARYFNALGERALKRHKKRLITHAVVASGAATAFFKIVPSWITIMANAGVVAFSLHSLVFDYTSDSATLRMVSNGCRDLEVKLRGLWLEIENNRREALSVERRWYELAQDLSRMKESAGSISIDVDLSERTARDVVKVIQEELT